ncbi:MAG: HPr family phosphocarrier protein [Desulfovibrionaceae bacterium]|nr:HPr family phosphocarrier protein [Desulfovibrionaceae bacterium]MBF0514399.1 HPr family phosphocarrier protein [Desulfovibrionaceae bacterium]
MTRDMQTDETGPELPGGAIAPLRRVVFVLNEQGLHARPAAKLAQEAQKYASEIKIVCNGATVDAKSILDVLTLAAGNGTSLELAAAGPDAAEALDSLARLFKQRFQV